MNQKLIIAIVVVVLSIGVAWYMRRRRATVPAAEPENVEAKPLKSALKVDSVAAGDATVIGSVIGKTKADAEKLLKEKLPTLSYDFVEEGEQNTGADTDHDVVYVTSQDKVVAIQRG